jgi:hypothetical protein
MDQDRLLSQRNWHFGWAIQFHCQVTIAAGVPVCPAEASVARFALAGISAQNHGP